MIAVISPAKSLNIQTENPSEYTLPRMPKETRQLVSVMKEKEPEDLKSLMDISDDLALLNVERFQSFSQRHTTKNSRTSISCFNGDVYRGLDFETLSEQDLTYAQQHLRILSGLYGLLRPQDLIQPYRLEMGTRLGVKDYKSLYEFWGTKIARLLRKDLKNQGDDILINLASQEYFASVDKKALKARIIDVEFKDFKNDEYKIISFFAKKARGLMSRFIIKNQLQDPSELIHFDYEGYRYDERSSGEDHLVFLRG